MKKWRVHFYLPVVKSFVVESEDSDSASELAIDQLMKDMDESDEYAMYHFSVEQVKED